LAIAFTFAALSHVTSTPAYYLQANPCITIALVAKKHLKVSKALQYGMAQIVGSILAFTTVKLAAGVNIVNDMAFLGSCPPHALSSSWSTLGAEVILSSTWVYVTIGSIDAMELSMNMEGSFYGLASASAYLGSATAMQRRGMFDGFYNVWLALLALIDSLVMGRKPLFTCAIARVAGPLLGTLVAIILSMFNPGINGSERQSLMRIAGFATAALVEGIGTFFIVVILGVSQVRGSYYNWCTLTT